MTKRLDHVEEMSRDIVARHLQVPVVQHDDNSMPSMPDLRIEYPDGKIGLVEVIRDVDQRRVELNAALNSQVPRPVPDLTLNWWINVTSRAHLKKADKGIVGLLVQAEQNGRTQVEGTPYTGIDPLGPALIKLGVVRARSFAPPPGMSGTITYSTVDGFAWDGTLDCIPRWTDEVLSRAPDVANKLARASCDERHAFFVSALHGDTNVYWALSSKPHPRNGNQPAPLPTTVPTLPTAVDKVWVMGPERTVAWFPDSDWIEVVS